MTRTYYEDKLVVKYKIKPQYSKDDEYMNHEISIPYDKEDERHPIQIACDYMHWQFKKEYVFIVLSVESKTYSYRGF